MKSPENYYEKYQFATLDMRREQLSQWLRNYAAFPQGKVLDLGCWNGDFLKMVRSDWEKWGIDLARHHDLPEKVQFLCADVTEDFPVVENHFDLVFAGEIIEHLLSTQIFLERCHQILKPGGVLILTTPNLSCWLNLWRWFSLGQPNNVSSDEGQDGHVRYLAPKTLRNALEKAGFQILEITSSGGLIFLQTFPRFYRFFFNVFPMRGKHLMAIAQKL
jgi:2-polyprenyl-3-methyl-5-hydroxy-6-metoxy-1,4-benzoquinol methylase